MSRDPYARIAPWYDRLLEGFNAPLRAISLKMCQPSAGMKVLDVGCGTGANLIPYVEAGCDVFGVDASEAMLTQARERLGDSADLTLGDAADMPYEDNTFDIVRASMFLHELAPDVIDGVLCEMSRVLASDGRIVVVDFAGSELTPRGRGLRAVSMIAERIAGRQHHRNCRVFLAIGGVPGLTRGVGLETERSRHLGGGNIGIYILTH